MVDRTAAAQAIEAFLRALGHEPVGDLQGTGERVADAWIDDFLEGDAIDAAALLREGSIELHDEPTLVVLRDVAVTTMCPHHLLPAYGTATVAYLPDARIAGIGTLAHVVDVVSRRLTLQERIGRDVVDLLVAELGARGAACRLQMTHTCLVGRGERKAGTVVETLALAGSFNTDSRDYHLALSVLR